MKYNIKIILVITCFIAFAFNKVSTIPTINNNQTDTKNLNEQDKKIKNPELKKLLDKLKEEFLAEKDILKKEFKQREKNLKEEYSIKRKDLVKKYRTENKSKKNKKIKTLPDSSDKDQKTDNSIIKKKPINIKGTK